MSTKPGVKVTVARRYDQTPSRIFDAWLDPAMIGRFMFGPTQRDEEVLHIKLDPKVDGSFSFLVRRGEEEIDHVGKYLEIKRPELLSFTWGIKGESDDESVVTISLAPADSGSEATLTHKMDPKWAAYAERTREAWTKMLDALDQALREG
jgi:uncharacterized protein YndB with AHSA1/START domain